MGFEYYLEWFDPEREMLLGREIIDIPVEGILYLMELSRREFIDAYVIQASEKIKLQPHVDHLIDLNQFDYFLAEYKTEETNRWRQDGF